ncbi:hypothetical protein Gotur_028697 [Gossypium turneri]
MSQSRKSLWGQGLHAIWIISCRGWRGSTTDKRQGEIGTWKEFQCELKGQFYPEFVKEEARAKQEVEQRGVQKLPEAMTVRNPWSSLV